MAADPAHFHKSNLWSTPSRDVGLTIESTRLEPILGELDEDVADIEYSLDQYYGRATASAGSCRAAWTAR